MHPFVQVISYNHHDILVYNFHLNWQNFLIRLQIIHSIRFSIELCCVISFSTYSANILLFKLNNKETRQ